MDAPTRERVSIDLRGLGPALRAHARTRNLRLPDAVRIAVVAMLEAAGPESAVQASGEPDAAEGGLVKLTMRLRRGVAARLTTRARACGLAQSAYVTTLIDETPAPLLADVTALRASTDQLAVVSADLNELVRAIRRGALSSAPLIEDWLKPLVDEMRRHVDLASRLVVELRPRSTLSAAPRDPRAERREPRQ